MTVKKLEKQFLGIGEVNGFKFTMVNESDNAYLYRVNQMGKIHYEVFKKKLTPICIDFENRIYSPDHTKEVYPKSKDFGRWAFTFSTIAKATNLFKKL